MESGGGRVDPPQGGRTKRGGGGGGGRGRGLADGGHQEDSAAAALKGHGHEAKTTWPEEMTTFSPVSFVTKNKFGNLAYKHRRLSCVRAGCKVQTLLCF